MIVQIKGKTYYGVRISLFGKNFDTPKRGESKIVDIEYIPKDLIDLQDKNIISINIDKK